MFPCAKICYIMNNEHIVNRDEFSFNLHQYGWNDKLNQLKQNSLFKSLPHGRIATVHRTCYEVISESGLLQCELTGNMLFGKSAYELPCTGDWIIFQQFEEDKGIIVDILPRERVLDRKKNGTISDKQAIAAYIDKAFIVQSLDSNFNMRRAERFAVQIFEANIQPILVLNKADLDFDHRPIAEATKHFQLQMPVYLTSIHQPETITALRNCIGTGETVVMVGSSGVGKSSLVNALCEKPAVHTSAISESTGKGRHTSTRRQMVEMTDAGILIDTPGVREFGLTTDGIETLTDTLDMKDYVGLCRFKDCTHHNEPGCAVLEAVKNGNLDQKIYQSYLKLEREIDHFSTSSHQKRKKERSQSKLLNEYKKRQGLRR